MGSPLMVMLRETGSIPQNGTLDLVVHCLHASFGSQSEGLEYLDLGLSDFEQVNAPVTRRGPPRKHCAVRETRCSLWDVVVELPDPGSRKLYAVSLVLAR